MISNSILKAVIILPNMSETGHFIGWRENGLELVAEKIWGLCSRSEKDVVYGKALICSPVLVAESGNFCS